MAAFGSKLISMDGMNLDVAPQYLKSSQARYVKNLIYQLSDFGNAGTAQGASTGVLKPLPSNEIFCPLTLPLGDNHVIGALPSTETKELYVWVFNSLNNHFIFRADGTNSLCEIIKIDPCFNFKLDPRYFIGEGQCWIEVVYLIDPNTSEPITKKDLYWTDGFNYQGYLRVDDSIATNGFDATLYPYFLGNYDKCALVRMGVPTPDDCITISQVPFDIADIGKNNNLKFSTWQFRISDIDVFGRPSEHGIISDLYYISSNQCLSASDALSRCVALSFDAGNPFVDKKQIEYRNCNDNQWYLDTVLELYEGSNISQWWLRPRNPDIEYDFTTNKITYNFCKDKLCDPIDPTETKRTAPGLARTSQSLTKIGKSISLANNKDQFPPFGKTNVLNNLSVIITKPVTQTVGQTANITVWIRIYNPHVGQFQKVWKKGTDYVFGGIVNGHGIDNIKTSYQQYFAVTGQQGYFGYLAGTSNYAVGVQYHLDANNNFVIDADFNTEYDTPYYMKFEFLGVPKANYIFALASHLSDPNVSDITATSTYVGGVYNFSNYVVGIQKNIYKELKINACESDYDTMTSGEMLLAYDLTDPKYYGNRLNPFFSQGHFSDSTVVDGYVSTDINQLTGQKENFVHLLQVSVDTSGSSNFNSGVTDRNGFYFATSVRISNSSPNERFVISMIGYCQCIKKTLINASVGKLFQRYDFDFVLGRTSVAPYNAYCTDFETYKCSSVLVKGIVQLCGDGTGVPNVNVVLARGGMATTDSNGNFTIIAYDDVTNGNRTDEIFIMGGGCAFTACDGTCIEVRSISFAPCTTCVERDVDAGIYEVLFISSRGPLSGGRYGVSLTGYDWLGRHGFSQTLDKLYFDIPTLNEVQGFGFSTVDLVIPPSVTFDSWVDYVTIGVTLELNYGGNFIEWIADKVTFINNKGVEDDAAPTQIRIDYGSLNEYNIQNGANTTTGWQITPETSTTTVTNPNGSQTTTTDTPTPRTADIVQFIRNGDGKFFSSPVSALVKYDQTGQYFLINYTSALKDLKENALIRLANPNDCTNKDIFFELCGKYKVLNGKILQNTIRVNLFDTYYQYRQIPVPVTTVDNTVPATPVTTTVIELRQFGFPFEHPSVTDFWGSKCWNIGRINAKNPYENEIIHLNQVALSGALSENGQLNYLNYFDDSNKVTFNVNNTGGIVYIRIKTGMAFIVCQFKNFVVGYGDNIARLNSQYIVSVPSAEDAFGKPERATTGDYGCQLFDKSTVRERLGLVHWIDRNRVAILQNDFQETVDVSRYNRANSTIVSWLLAKIKYQQSFNEQNNNSRYFHAVIDPLSFAYLLSEFTIGGSNYVNTERQIDVTQQETISFGILTKVWNQFMSPTPEYFSFLDNADKGQALFSFMNGVAYSHTGSTFNTFFGIECDRVYRFIFNLDGFKKKKNLAMGVYCPESLYFADQIITENKQLSRLLKVWWKKALYFWSAAFLCNLNTPYDLNIPQQTGVNKLTDADNLEGSWIDVRLIGDPDNDNLYSELYGVTIFSAPEESSGTTQ